jgi:carboxymethylenebutenolidase
MTEPLTPAQQKMLARTNSTPARSSSRTAPRTRWRRWFPTRTWRSARAHGGNGAAEVEDFYEHHFIFNMPPDMELVPVNRIIGGRAHRRGERVPLHAHGRARLDAARARADRPRVEIAVVSIVKMEGEKLAHEHIYWDQASVLAQLGLLDTEKLPVVGADGARKILDRTVPVNQLMKRLRAKGAKR